MRLFEKFGVRGELTLRELEALACAGLAGLFALLGPWIAAKKAGGFEGWTKLGIVDDQSAGDGQFDGIGLSVESTAARNSLNVELVLQVCDLKGLEKLTLQSESGEDVLKGLVVNGDFSGSSSQPDAGNCGLTTSGCGKSFAHGILINE